MNVIIDASALGHQARFATGDLEHQSQATGVIYGFLRQVLTLADTFQTSDFIFCWDGKNYLRREIYPEYKKSRSKTLMTEQEKQDYEIAMKQFEQLYWDILPAMGFRNNFRVDRYEADDTIAYIVKEYDGNFVVVSSDGDLYQLLDYCKMYLQKKKKFYTKQDFMDEYGIEPSRWAEAKAIAGCSTDNVEGVKGVGEKTAAKYLIGALKETSQAYFKIREGSWEGIIPRNRRLVTLPMEGFPGVELTTDEVIPFSDFEAICRRYGLKSFREGRLAEEWNTLFNRRRGI